MEIIYELARSALNAPSEPTRAQEAMARYGFRPFPKRGGIVTNELIDRLRDHCAC